jgi:BNR repeat-like domain
MRKNGFSTILLAAGLFCLVSNTFAGWGGVKRLTWTSASSLEPVLAIDSGNVIHLVWNEFTSGGNDEIYYRKSTDGGATWTASKRLTWTSGASSSPALAIDSKKGLHVIWYDDTPGNQEIYYKRSLDGGATWDATKRLTWTAGSSYYTAIATDSNDAIHISWTDNTSGNYQIYYKKSTDRGSTWGAMKRVSWTSVASFGPAIAVDSTNHIHIVCEDYITGNEDIYYTKSTNGGETWSTLKRLTWTSAQSTDAAVAIDSGDSIHLVWNDYMSASDDEIYYRKSTDGGSTWSAAKKITSTSGYSSTPALTIDAGDTIHLVWSDNTPGNWEIYYKKSTDGGSTWSASQRLTWNSGNSQYPAVATDSGKTVDVVWQDQTPGNWEIYYRKGS